MSVSGYVFNDANNNGLKGSGENGIGLAMFVKLVPRSGSTCGTTATQAMAADPTTGAYNFAGVAPGDYCLVVDNNSTLTDVTPTSPQGYSATTPTTITSITIVSSPVTDQNFGLKASPPTPVNDVASTAQNTSVTASVATNDSDPDGNLNPNGFTKLTNPAYQVCDLTSPTPLCATATVGITVTAGPPQIVSGYVFNDANNNGLKGSGENGIGLAMFVKLVPRSGSTCGTTATQAVTADPTTGAYSFTGVAPGDYCLVVDNNNTLTDVAPTSPQGYINTTPSIISSVTVITVAITDQNFGFLSRPPVPGDDAVSTVENTPVTASVATNDSDPDGNLNPNGFTKLTNPAHGTVVFNADGTYTYTPNTNYLGSRASSDSFRLCLQRSKQQWPQRKWRSRHRRSSVCQTSTSFGLNLWHNGNSGGGCRSNDGGV
ncbi:MAG: cadherin-like domain-containing protein [Spirosoma sp.]|nr:cadherin-like domain-containing protein [Spirosoma sp.]